jgi:tryptophan synthase alpha chain
LSRIAEAFKQMDQSGASGFIPFVTAGDPDLETTEEILFVLAEAGATVIELGVPFSDPMADGPVIQRASERALKHEFGLAEIFAMVRRVRERIQTPIILFSYFNPLLRFGIERLAQSASEAGVDGVLVTDLTPEEADDFYQALRAHDLDMIFLVAPTSTDARLQLIASKASGFIYAVSRAGVTGTRDNVSVEAERLVDRVRQYSNLPIAVGFGISNSGQVGNVQKYADAAVVGSAIVQELERLQGTNDIPAKIGEFVRNLLPDKVAV